MRPATIITLVLLLVLLVGAAVMQIVFKVGGTPTGTAPTSVTRFVTTTTAG